MRQTTTPAIALLVGLASAVPGLSNASTSAGQSPFPDPVGAWGAASDANLLTLSNSTATTLNNVAAATPAQLSCVQCIRGGQVWCSNRYLAEKDAVWGTTQVIASEIVNNPAIVADGTGAVDRGQCCFSNLYIAQNVVAAWLLRANYMSCFAAYTNDAGSTMGNGATSAAAGSATALATRTDANFWCSNGQSNMLAMATAPAPTIIVGQFGVVAAGTAISTSGNTEGDPRTEFWLIACRQRSDQCGAAYVAAGALSTLGVAAVTAQQRTVLVAGSPTIADKCSWIYRTQIGAPTFIIDKDATTDVIIDSKWTLHYVEYSTNTNFGMTHDSSGTKYVFDMYQNWSKFRARYYNTAAYNGYQEYGEVWTWVDAANTASTPQQYAKRWFPISVVGEQVTRYNTLATNYNNAKGSYNTLAADYNKKVKAAKDFNTRFAANSLIAMEEHPIPARPVYPTRLHAYDGYSVAHYDKTSSWTTFSGTSNLTGVVAGDVVIDGSHSGGWGSFTAGILSTATVKAAHSFGVFGWSDSASDTNAEKYSYLQSLVDMCPDADAATISAAYQNCPVPATGTYATDSTTWSVVIVSVWANDVTATAFASGGSGATLKVSFGLNIWAQNMAMWAAPTQPGAPDTLEAPVGATYLAASSAALAVAAALY